MTRAPFPFASALAACLALLTAWVQAAEVPADARVALVMGNSTYPSSPLINPVNDARAVARALKELGFEVFLHENFRQQSFLGALREFGKRLKETGGVGLFYYAGHGMQVKGSNYLIPVDAQMQSEDEVRYLAIDANQVLDKMEQAGNRLNIVILDACRDNPFARSFRSKQAGLAQMDAPSGMLIAFATAPGAVAYDGDGVNGVYTKHLLRNLTIPGLPVELMLKRVREGVSQETGQKQIPWESSSLMGDFTFKPGVPSAASDSVRPPVDQTAIDLAFWDSIKNSDNPSDFRTYLERFPQGQFASLAKKRAGGSEEQGLPTTITGVNWQLGDFCLFELHYGSRQAYVVKETVRAAYVSRVLVTTEHNGKPFDVVIDPGTGRITKGVSPANGEPIDIVPSARFFDWPLEPGKRWEDKYSVRGRSFQGEVSASFYAERWEKVSVPAGEFYAMKVVREETFTGRNANWQPLRGTSTLFYWVSPQARCVVRQDYENSLGDRSTRVLMAYRTY